MARQLIARNGGLTGLLIALIVGGCAATDHALPPAVGIQLGSDTLGESCLAVPRPLKSADAGAAPPIDIMCGKSVHPSGTMLAMSLPAPLPVSGDAARKTIEEAVATSPLTLIRDEQLICKAPVWSTPGDGQPYTFLVAACKSRDGDWPYVSIATVQGDRLYLGSSIPAAVLVLQRTIGLTSQSLRSGIVSAEQSAPAAERETRIKQLEAALGQPLAAFGSEDIDKFRDLMELGRLYDSVQDYPAAERAYLQALQVQTRALSQDNPALADTLLSLALEISSQGRAEEAEALFRRATPLLQRNVDPLLQARYASYQALAAANRGEFRDALALAQDAVARREQMLGEEAKPGSTLEGEAGGSVFAGATAIRGELAQGLYLEAALALKLDDVSTARSAITAALDILNDTQGLPVWWRPRFLIVAAEINQRMGRAEDAETQLAVALDIATGIYDQSGLTASVQFALGRLYFAEGLPGKAVDAFRRARDIVAKEHRAQSPQQALNWSQPYLDALAELSRRMPEHKAALEAEMFDVGQSIRGGVTAQTVARTAARIATTDPAIGDLVRSAQDTVRQRDMLQLALANESSKPSDRRDAAVEADFSRRLSQSTAAASALEIKLRTAYPAYSQMVDPEPLSANRISAKLSNGEGLLFFVVGRKQSYGFLLTQQGLSVRSLGITATDLDDRVSDLRRAFTVQAGAPQPFDLRASFQLYQLMLGPFEPEIARITHLIVVPSGGLFSLPLGLLVTADPPKGERPDYAKAAWLARRTAISVAPSVEAFLGLHALKTRPSAPEPFIGFGAPLFTGAASQATNSLQALGAECLTNGPVSSDLIRALAPLPETADEVRRIAGTLKAPASDIILGAEVTKATLRNLPLERYRVLYFATHGLLPGELRCQAEPGLALTPPASPPASAEDDGLLATGDISTLHLDADLVVLSACNTAGDGGHLGGQALSGLADAFFFAGSRSVLASHWQVPSLSTVTLMTDLFSALARDNSLGVAEALRQSEMAVASNPKTAHPFYWSAFTLIGDGSVHADQRTALQP